ncbi:hypothetical protein G4923_09300 [Aeromonas rivipollensis]|uniref:Uncharacterized protein n=1 Tax=Aeromonas rivipollensis TaxID=948519 RepID=A0AAW9YAW6_9GAMM|nr:hypothetical protein [Aeromonas rivipollensis]NEX74814.1 hypothetical protein [Aeromonas rivipollensis]NEX88899.1 hypothetical protein [Aeromonas rivipollensis]NEY04638.1 hypothetical protein [Aeromonas rivipollensis]
MSLPVLSVDDWPVGNVSIDQQTPNFFTETVSGRVRSYERGLHMISFKFDVWLPYDSDVKRMNAFMLQCRGRANPFVLDLGNSSTWFNPLTSQARRITLGANAGIGQKNITLVGSVSSISEGEYFQMPNDTKLYVVIGKSGQNVEVYPPLLIAHKSGETLNFENPRPQLRLEKDEFTLNLEGRGKTISISAKEVI